MASSVSSAILPTSSIARSYSSWQSSISLFAANESIRDMVVPLSIIRSKLLCDHYSEYFFCKIVIMHVIDRSSISVSSSSLRFACRYSDISKRSCSEVMNYLTGLARAAEGIPETGELNELFSALPSSKLLWLLAYLGTSVVT